jgi:hypothetical protein
MARMTTARKLLLGLLGGGGTAGYTYLFRDEFTTDVAAGSVDGTPAEPGPGTRALVSDSNNVSISGDKLLITNSTSRTARYRTGNLTRATGLAFFINGGVSSAPVAAGIELGVTNTSNTRIAYISPRAGPEYIAYNGDAVFVEIRDILGIAAADYAYITRSAGGAFFARVSGDWTLLWLDSVATTTPMRFAFWLWLTSGSTGVIEASYFRVRQLDAPFTTDNGFATLDVTSPSDATEYTGDANAIIDLTVTAPGSLDGDANTRCGFYYRADADLSPAWHAYVDGLGAFNLDSIDAGGTRTNRITAAAAIAGGATRTIRVMCAGTKHNAYTLSSTTWTKRGSEITLSLNDAVITIEPSIPAGWTGADLRCYPINSSLYGALDPN